MAPITLSAKHDDNHHTQGGVSDDPNDPFGFGHSQFRLGLWTHRGADLTAGQLSSRRFAGFHADDAARLPAADAYAG
jgi:hypothetical protein